MQSRRIGHIFRHADKGFTIVELLIVIVVIAILAAITIVAYNGITQRANASAAQEAITAAQKKIALYAVDNADSLPPDLTTAGITATNGITYQYSVNTSTTPPGYCVTASLNGIAYYLGSSFSYTGSSNGTIDQSNPTSGACPGHSVTGTSISNLSPDPGAEVNVNIYGGPNASVIIRDSSRAHNGTYSVRTTMPAYASGNVGLSLLQSTVGGAGNVQPNTAYTVSAYVYVPSGSVSPFITVQGAGKATIGNPGGNGTNLKDQWVRIYNTFTTSASGAIAFYVLNNATTTAGMQYWVDDVMIAPGTTLPNFADGDSPGWVWNGTQKVSTSTGPAL